MCLLPEPKMDFESQAVFVLSELYDVMGDHLALQYAGSVAHKKYQVVSAELTVQAALPDASLVAASGKPSAHDDKLERALAPVLKSVNRLPFLSFAVAASGARGIRLLTSIHRHYNNSFTDREKQACLNLFLGLYQPAIHPSMEKLDCFSLRSTGHDGPVSPGRRGFRLATGDSWVHHKVLKDDYSPGVPGLHITNCPDAETNISEEWWVEPLQKHRRNLLPLISKECTFENLLLQGWQRPG
ncbi:unnamed protein product [Symbiodinium sp. CCMP2592]|nr:unnamed protein product [Symbiodinium sp. CCMP2592]